MGKADFKAVSTGERSYSLAGQWDDRNQIEILFY